MVNTLPSIRSGNPTTSGRAPSWRRHRRSLITTTSAPSPSPSASTSPRPSGGTTPITLKNEAVTLAPSMSCGSPLPVRLADDGVIAVAPENTPLCVVTSMKFGGE